MAEYRRVLRDQGPRRTRRGPAPRIFVLSRNYARPHFQSSHQMNTYRIVVVDDAGQASRQRSFVCADDDDAIVWAKQLEGEIPIEIWSGARFVARLVPQTRAKT